jgi:hypothetical protein
VQVIFGFERVCEVEKATLHPPSFRPLPTSLPPLGAFFMKYDIKGIFRNVEKIVSLKSGEKI